MDSLGRWWSTCSTNSDCFKLKQTKQAGESYNGLDFRNTTFFCFILKHFSRKECSFILISRRLTTHPIKIFSFCWKEFFFFFLLIQNNIFPSHIHQPPFSITPLPFQGMTQPSTWWVFRIKFLQQIDFPILVLLLFLLNDLMSRGSLCALGTQLSQLLRWLEMEMVSNSSHSVPEHGAGRRWASHWDPSPFASKL